MSSVAIEASVYRPRQIESVEYNPFRSEVSLPTRETTQQDIDEITRLQQNFFDALNIDEDPKEYALRRSFNPVVERWHVEKLLQKGDFAGLQGFKSEIYENLRTNLMERLQSEESYGEYAIRNGELYSRDFVDKPFSEVLKFGVEYRANMGSNEQEREGEQGELRGWEIINSGLTNQDAEIGTTFYSLSPRGLADDTVYEGWFVDRFTLKEEEGERYVERLRTGVDWNYENYVNAALSIDASYFDEYDGRPLDAWLLAHPLKAPEGTLDLSKQGLSNEETARILNDSLLQRIINRFESAITARHVNWYEVALSFNAMLNHADDLKEGKVKIRDVSMEISNIYNLADEDIAFEKKLILLGVREVETKGGAGCPPNKGIKLNLPNIPDRIEDLIDNSVAKFGFDMDKSCPCGQNTDGHYHCPGCGRKFGNESGLSASDRTKGCGCGFKFGC